MDSFDLKESPAPRRRSLIWNVLTILALLASLCLVITFVLIFVNPYTALNPFPPPTVPTPYLSPTPTWTPRPLAATWTATATLQPSKTMTPRPTFTFAPTNTSFVVTGGTSRVTPTSTRTPSSTPVPTGIPFVYEIKEVASDLFRPELGCDYAGVAGQVMSENNSPILYQYIQLGGTLGGQTIDLLALSGTAPAFGQGAYEFVLGEEPIASSQTLWIQVTDQAGIPLSEKIYFDTYDTCNKNLILIRFTKVP